MVIRKRVCISPESREREVPKNTKRGVQTGRAYKKKVVSHTGTILGERAVAGKKEGRWGQFIVGERSAE